MAALLWALGWTVLTAKLDVHNWQQSGQGEEDCARCHQRPTGCQQLRDSKQVALLMSLASLSSKHRGSSDKAVQAPQSLSGQGPGFCRLNSGGGERHEKLYFQIF